jgi:hypothetical protein
VFEKYSDKILSRSES